MSQITTPLKATIDEARSGVRNKTTSKGREMGITEYSIISFSPFTPSNCKTKALSENLGIPMSSKTFVL